MGKQTTKKGEEQTSIQINLRKSTDERLTDLCEANRWIKKHVISDVLEDWMNLDASVREIAINKSLNPIDLPTMARIVLERMAAGERVRGKVFLPGDVDIERIGDNVDDVTSKNNT